MTIVCACRNEAAHISTLLESVLQQDFDGIDWEAIIADGMSEDGTRELIERCSAGESRLRLIANPGRIVSTGLNAAIRAARGNIIIRMDAHTRYAADYCRRCVETLEQTGAENVGGPALTEPHGVVPRAVAAAFHSRFSTGGARFHDARYRGYVDTVTYGCWKRETLVRIGMFDEWLVRNQDDEINLRLVRAGGRIWQNPEIRSWYSPRPSLASLWRQYFQYGYWKVAVISKHKIPASWRHLVPCAFLLLNIMLPAAGAAALLAGGTDVGRGLGWLWTAGLAVYGGAVLLASAVVARRAGMDLFPVLPFVFAVYHLSYGFGFCAGLLRSALSRNRPVAQDALFSRMTD